MRQLTPHAALQHRTPKPRAVYATHITGITPLPAPASDVRYYCNTCKQHFTLHDPNAVNPHGSHDYVYQPNWALNS